MEFHEQKTQTRYNCFFDDSLHYRTGMGLAGIGDFDLSAWTGDLDFAPADDRCRGV